VAHYSAQAIHSEAWFSKVPSGHVHTGKSTLSPAQVSHEWELSEQD